jgi:ribonuclease III
VLDIASELEALAVRLHHDFTDHGLLERALAHRSWCAENGGQPSNERLEFLGDAVLGLCVTDHIYREYPDFSEGELAKVRAAIVNAGVLAETAVDYGLGPTLLLGNGEDQSGGREKPSILSDSFEAVIGAVYLDGGWGAAQRFIVGALSERISEAAENPGTQDYKTRLQELAARHYGSVPRYEVDDSGPDHRKSFAAEVIIGDEVRGSGAGRSKKQAEQQAARDAWSRLDADAVSSDTTVEPVHDTEGETLDG